MDIRQGKIRNLNKRLFVGVLSFTLLSSAIVGYSDSNRIKFEKHRYENFTGIASFEKKWIEKYETKNFRIRRRFKCKRIY